MIEQIKDGLSTRLRIESWGRIAILAVMLIGWVGGVSFAIENLSPLNALVAASPVENDESNRETLHRLTIQSEMAERRADAAEKLSSIYSAAASEIQTALNVPPQDARDGLLKIIDVVQSIRTNPKLVSGGYEFLMEIRANQYSDRDTTTKNPTELVIVVQQPRIGLTRSDDGGIAVPLSSIVDYAKAEKVTAGLLTRYDSGLSVAVLARTGEDYEHPQVGRDQAVLLARRIVEQWDEAQPAWVLGFDLQNSQPAVLKIRDELVAAVQLQQAAVAAESADFREVSDNLRARLLEFESRMLSSQELFYVVAIRASLITIIVVAVGYVLLRAFAAELTQARRLANVELTARLMEAADGKHLHHVPEVLRAVAGDRPGPAPADEGEPLDAGGAANQVAEAFRKVAAAVKDIRSGP